METLEDVFVGMGFTIAEGPEVETDWHNFGALNFPPDHPARDMYDTLYVEMGEPGSTVLRTHTSPVQVRVMTSQEPPIYMVMPGRVFRQDTPDATHMPVFHQIEGLVIDRDITFADLAGTLDAFTKAFFGGDFTSRLRPVVLPVHRALGRVRHPTARRLVAGAGWLRDGAPQRAHQLRHRPRGVAGLRLRLRTRPPRRQRPRRRRPPRPLHQRHPLPLPVLGAPPMKVLLSWLRDFAPFEGDPVALGEEMSDLGMAVEELERIGEGLDGIVVARVLETRAVEGANKIHQVIVDAGDGQPLEIGCGAFNMQAGDLVPLATIGTVMPNGMEIGRRKMAGVWSNGMLCSSHELGLGGDHDGILLLPAHLEPGTPFTEAMGIEPDVLYDLEINPNRPDAMSIAGVARDLAARLRLPFALPDPSPATVAGRPRSASVSVEILDPDRCGSFEARVLRGVTVGPGDPKLADPARAARACDRSATSSTSRTTSCSSSASRTTPTTWPRSPAPGSGCGVARDGETLTTLDDVERRLTPEDLLICDGDDVPVGLAGIMGGATSEIDDATTDVLLEMAWFHPIGIVKSSRRHKLRSEASARFEKGTDPEVIDLAMRRFADAARRPARGRPAVATGDLPERPPVRLRTARVARLLGTDLGAGAHRGGARPDRLHHHAGRRRPRRRDPVVALRLRHRDRRHRGGRPAPRLLRPSVAPLPQRRDDRRAVAAAGGPTAAPVAPRRPRAHRGHADAVPRARGAGRAAGCPTTASRSPTRSSPSSPSCGRRCCPGWSARSRTTGRTATTACTCSRSATRSTAHRRPDADLPDEREALGVVLGRSRRPRGRAPLAVRRRRRSASPARDRERRGGGVPPHPQRPASACAGASVGRARRDRSRRARCARHRRAGGLRRGRPRRPARRCRTASATYRPFSLYPSSDIDLAFEVDDDVPASAVEDAIRAAGGELLWSVRLFDVYRGAGVADGRRSLAFTLRFQAPDRTLTEADVAQARTTIIEAVESAVGATLRG